MNILKPIASLFSQKTAPIVEARAATPMSSIIQPKAQDRLYELIEREQLPGDVRETLAGALTGDLPRQQLLFQAMIDTWPRLQKNLTEIARSVSSTPWEIRPYSEQGDEPTDSSIEKARMVQTAIQNMSPRPAWDELSERGLVKSLVRGYYQGHEVCEVFWDRKAGGTMPRAAKIVPPRFYDYPDTGDDRLMFSPDGGFYNNNFEDFPEHHFLVAVNRGHGAHPSIAAPLRALTGYWLAATFGLKWLLQFSQLYGMPFRWASYEDESVKSKVCNMLENIGSAGWGAFPKGTEIEFINAGQSADSLPQAMLLEMADTQCDTFILGQTLTTDVGNSGSRALGDIHQEIRSGVIQGVSDFVGDIFNHQLIPSIIKLNYGNDEELPTYSSTVEAPKDEIGMAQRDQTLISMGMEVGKEWLYERHGVPMPEEGDDDIFQPSGGNGGGGDPRTGSNRVLSPNETDPAEADPDQDNEEVEASMVRAYDPNQKRAEKGSDNGGQWVKEDGSNSKGDKPKKSRGLSDEELARHAELEAKHNAGTLTDEERDEAQELVDKAARLAGYDVDNPMYHGTTHDFETFDPSIGSPEGDFGRGNYLTSSLEDAEANYAGGGPDLEGRMDRERDVLEFQFEGAETADEIEDVAIDYTIKHDLDSGSMPRLGADEDLEAWKQDLTEHLVRDRLHGGDDRLITAYTKLDNPAMIGENADGKQMYVEPLDMYDEDAMAEYKPEAEALVRKEYELDATDDIADYSSEVREAQENWAADNSYYNEEAHPLQEAVIKVSNRFSDVEADELADLDSVVFEGGSYADVADTLRQKVFQYATNDDGDLVTGEAVRQVFEEMGHDAVIDYRVDDKFKNMAGNYEGNYHIISFKSSQIKSADIFTGTPLAERFDDKDDRITFSHAVQAYDPNQKRAKDGRWTDGAISRGVIDKVERSHIDSYDGQDDYELVAYKGDDVMGYLSYSEHEGNVSISMVETRETHKRKGIATELYKELVKLHGEKAISSSFATKDGSALRKALEKRGIIKKDGTVVKSSNAVQAYDPNQKRGAKGTPDGGRWVDEDGGDGLKLYHGTKAKIDKFALENAGDSSGFEAFGRGIYLTMDKQDADFYAKDGGNVYEVAFKGDNDALMDWNKSIKSQPQKVKDAFVALAGDGVMSEPYSDRPASTIYNNLMLGKSKPTTAQVTSKMQKAGIEGIIHKVENNSGGQSSNIVIFNPDDLAIEKPKKLESANATRPTIDQLSDNVLESLTGVTREWLSPVRPHFEKLAAMAMSKQVSDADFIEALEKSQRDIPELFDKLNVKALQTHMNDAIGTAMIAGSVERYEGGEVKAYDPNQKRGEAGTPQGGRWVKEDGPKSRKEKTIERFGDEASSMMRKLKENEGFTLNLDGTDELSGYAVSIDKSSERVFDELTEENIEDYIREFWDELTLEGRHLGGWYNKANNKIYLDVPIIVDDFDTATRLASENDQIAFFHLDTFTEYQTDEAIRQIKER